MITIHRTDTKSLEIEFYDKQGNPADLTGKTVRFVLKRELSDTNIILDKPIAVVGNKATVELSSTDTDIPESVYIYGFIIEDTNTHETIFIDKLQILPALKRAI